MVPVVPRHIAQHRSTERGASRREAAASVPTAPRELSFWERLFGQRPSDRVERPTVQHASYRTKRPAPPAGIEAPRRSGGWSLFGGGSTGSSAARAELLRSTGNRVKPNHVYVVQLDRNNSGAGDAGELKGKTYVFSTGPSGELALRGTFKSSSQPMRADPYGSEGVSAHATKNGSYRYPYILEGSYNMSTKALTGGTKGLAIDAHRAYRDTNRNGRIDANERQVRSTSLIRFHTSALGSAGCQTIEDSQWQSFVQMIGAYGRSGATYVLRRT